jgi:hypothetical protein
MASGWQRRANNRIGMAAKNKQRDDSEEQTTASGIQRRTNNGIGNTVKNKTGNGLNAKGPAVGLDLLFTQLSFKDNRLTITTMPFIFSA